MTAGNVFLWSQNRKQIWLSTLSETPTTPPTTYCNLLLFFLVFLVCLIWVFPLFFFFLLTLILFMDLGDWLKVFLLYMVRSSVGAHEFDMKYLKKVEGHIGRNVVNITMNMNSLNDKNYQTSSQKVYKINYSIGRQKITDGKKLNHFLYLQQIWMKLQYLRYT